MSNKKKYSLLCDEEKNIPIFSQPWWLDAVTNKNWDVCLVENDKKIIASMPYYFKNIYNFKILTQPLLTQSLGPWLKSINAKNSKLLSNQKSIMQSLIDQLPQYDYFIQNWNYSQTNWLPFYWKNFEATTNYTYVLEDISLTNKIWDGLKENIKTDIRKAKNKKKIRVRTDLPLKEFLDLNKMTFDRQSKKIPYSSTFVENLLEIAKKKNQCRWFIGQDEYKKNHAGVLIVWDHQSAYYLMGGGNPYLRSSGATSLCMWEAIKFASSVVNKFDFEGSMIESVERFFRGFGAIQKPYFKVFHKPSKIINTFLFFKKLFKRN